MSTSYNDEVIQQAYLEVLFHHYPLEIITEIPFLRVNINDQEYYLGHGGFYPIENLYKDRINNEGG